MIEEKISKSLRELEEGLKSIESAREQVKKTVNSYDGLNKTTGEYVTQLGNITTKVQEIVDSIGKDYNQKVKAYEKDRETVFNASKTAIDELSNATEGFKDSLTELKAKLKYSLIVNVISLVAIIVTIILMVR